MCATLSAQGAYLAEVQVGLNMIRDHLSTGTPPSTIGKDTWTQWLAYISLFYLINKMV